MGQRTTPRQIEREWLDYQQTFDDLLTRLGAQLARQAKAEKKRIRRLLEDGLEQPQPTHRAPPSTPAERKAELRRRAAEARGYGGVIPLRGDNLAPNLEEEP